MGVRVGTGVDVDVRVGVSVGDGVAVDDGTAVGVWVEAVSIPPHALNTKAINSTDNQ
jgi:hypothetical protein